MVEFDDDSAGAVDSIESEGGVVGADSGDAITKYIYIYKRKNERRTSDNEIDIFSGSNQKSCRKLDLSPCCSQQSNAPCFNTLISQSIYIYIYI